MAKKKIDTMVTAFRDGFQSVYGARVFTQDYIPAVEAAAAAGFDHFEAGGGACFQSSFFYCNENAFEAMDAFRKAAGPNAYLQTLARGNNVVGLESQPSDIIKLHAELFKKHGMTCIRNFDALNDINNLIYSGQCIHDAGLEHEVSVSMMELPPGSTGAHTPEFYMSVLRQILDANIPYNSVCFKDASGTCTPKKVYETIKLGRKMLPAGTRIVFHSHDTAGTGISCYQAAIEGGADQLDLSMAPTSGGTCQPDVLSMWHALRGTDYDMGIDVEKVREAEEVFKECMRDYFVPPESKAVEPLIPFSPMPGGALTTNTQMLRDNNLMHRYPEYIQAMGEVVRKGGFGTSVTPVSQFYFQQAFNNVMFGPWEKMADGYGRMVLGYFGRTPTEPDPEIVKIAAEQLELEPTTKTVLEINDADPNKGVEAAKKMLLDNGIADLSDENIFIAATCQQRGIDFLLGSGEVSVRKKGMEEAEKAYTVSVNGKAYSVKVDGHKAEINNKHYDFSVAEGLDAAQEQRVLTESEDSTAVNAPLTGKVFKVIAKEGEHVNEGDLLIVLDAMKMEIEVKSPASGVVSSVVVAVGDQITAGQGLISIN